MNLRNAKKIIYRTLDEYNNTFNTNLKLDDVIFVNDPNFHDSACIKANDIYYNHKYILNLKQSVFDGDMYKSGLIKQIFTVHPQFDKHIKYDKITVIE